MSWEKIKAKSADMTKCAAVAVLCFASLCAIIVIVVPRPEPILGADTTIAPAGHVVNGKERTPWDVIYDSVIYGCKDLLKTVVTVLVYILFIIFSIIPFYVPIVFVVGLFCVAGWVLLMEAFK